MKGKLWTVLVVMVVLSLGLAACGPTPTEAPPATPVPAEETPMAPPVEGVEDEWGVVTVVKGDPVKVGMATSLTGVGLDVLGIDEQRGAELALKDKPEILGFAVELQVEDSMCSAEGGQTVATKFVAVSCFTIRPKTCRRTRWCAKLTWERSKSSPRAIRFSSQRRASAD